MTERWRIIGKNVFVTFFALRIVCNAAAEGGTGLEITVEKPFTIAKSDGPQTWGHWCFPVLQKTACGDLLLSFNTGEDAFLATQAGTNLYRSTDGGHTWKPAEGWKSRSVSKRVREAYIRYNGKAPSDAVGGGCLGGLAGFCNLSDGTCVSFLYHTMRGEKPDWYVDSRWSSRDGGRTWRGPEDADFFVPGNALNEQGKGQAIWQRSVQLKNGDLVTVAHTLFAGDAKLRVIALGSSDKGRKWRYLTTVANNQKLDTEGFTEPIICQTAQGSLICLMRTEGGRPMYQAFSSDGGKTWASPAPAGVNGVAPDMHLLSSGVLACSYGRPGVNIMFSAEGTGNRWTNHTSIFTGRSTGYTSFAEISPGRLLLIFDALNFQDAPGGGPVNCIRGVYIDISKVGK